MKLPLAIGTALALIAVAACQQAEAPAPQPGTEAGEAAQDVQQASNAADSIRARQTHYKELGRSMKGITDEMKARSPSLDAVRGHAETMRRFAPQVMGWFPAGSGSEAGLKTRARAEIWSDPEGFRAAAERFVAAADGFHAAAQGEDLEAIRAAQAELGNSCRNCHDSFRAPEE